MPFVALLPPPLARLILRAAYRTARLWWRIRQAPHQGALVAVHHAGRLLVLRQSYQPLWTFPGGGVEAGEKASAAAARELREEVGLDVPAGDLDPSLTITRLHDARPDTVRFFALHCSQAPAISIDQREIVEARWLVPARALELRLLPHVRDYIRHVTTVDGRPP